MARPTAPLFGIGLFFGVLVGAFLTFSLTTTNTEETFDDYRKRMREEGGGGGGPSRTRPPRQQPPAEGGHGGGQGDPRSKMATIHFMKKFVKALTALPQNAHPAVEYEQLLRDGAQITCSDCHTDDTLDFDKMAAADPGPDDPFVQRMREDPRVMITLMTKWVERLNSRQGAKLKKQVTCTSCHAVDPKDKFRVYPALMNSFVLALKSKPTNKNPASNWRPLLKDPAAKTMLCAKCHGEVGTQMEAHLKRGAFNLSRPDKYADNQGFMVDLMEEWMSQANRDLKSVLLKPIACLDCHETDPRR